MATLIEMKKDDLKQPESITPKLERIACDYRKEVDDATAKFNEHLQNKLTELVEEFGHKAVVVAVKASETTTCASTTSRILVFPKLWFTSSKTCPTRRYKTYNRQPSLARTKQASSPIECMWPGAFPSHGSRGRDRRLCG